MKTYICNECKSNPCISNTGAGVCHSSEWHETEEYEIKKKDRFTMNEDAKSNVKYKSDKEGLHSYSKEYLDSIVPNCSECKWQDKQERNQNGFEKIYSRACIAQGYKTTQSCFNNTECKALYEVRE